MSWKLSFKSALVVTAVSLGLNFAQAVSAQSPNNPNVSVVQLMVQPGPTGGQMVLTPRGFLVPLPGPGVNGNTIDLYFGANGGYWYVDKNGKTNDITSYVNQVRAQSAKMPTAQAPQYAPAPAYNNYNYSSNPNGSISNTSTASSGTSSSSSSNSGGGAASALGTAAAAGVGAMAGASMAHYNNVPYGTPLYYHNNNPYYNGVDGKGVFVNDGEVQWNNVGKANQMQNMKQTQQINEAQANQAQRAAGRDAEQSQRQTEMQTDQKRREASMQDQSQQFAKQQKWYQEQSQDKGRAQAWQQQSSGENPFVRSQDGSGRSGSREASGNGFGSRGDGDGGGGGGLRGRGGGGREFGGARGGGGRRGR